MYSLLKLGSFVEKTNLARDLFEQTPNEADKTLSFIQNNTGKYTKLVSMFETESISIVLTKGLF